MLKGDYLTYDQLTRGLIASLQGDQAGPGRAGGTCETFVVKPLHSKPENAPADPGMDLTAFSQPMLATMIT